MFTSFEKFAYYHEKPDVIIEDGDTTYLMYALPGTSSMAEARWSICRIQKDNSRTTVMWAEGQRNFNLVADNYLSYTYKFKQF